MYRLISDFIMENSQLKLITEFDSDTVYCPVCSDSHYEFKLDLNTDRVNGYMKIAYKCCYMYIEHKVPENLRHRFLDNFYSCQLTRGYGNSYQPFDLINDTQEEINKAKEKIFFIHEMLIKGDNHLSPHTITDILAKKKREKTT